MVRNRRAIATRGRAWGGVLLLAGAAWAGVTGTARPADPVTPWEVVATGIARPLQLVVDGRTLIALSLEPLGDAAGELHRFPFDGDLPADLSRQPRVRIPFFDSRVATLGSLAIDPATRELFLGEENGGRVYRLTRDGRLALYVTGLHRLAGGSTLAFDARGRLVIVDYVEQAPPEDRGPPTGIEAFRDEDYRGPLVFRLELDPTLPLPRRLDRVSPLFPRAWHGGARGALLPRLISVTALPGGDLLLLTTAGSLFRLGPSGSLARFAELPPGQYVRTNMAVAPDGAVIVSGGFLVRRIFRVSPEGTVKELASDIADPEGVVVDDRGDLYVADAVTHRILRLRAF